LTVHEGSNVIKLLSSNIDHKSSTVHEADRYSASQYIRNSSNAQKGIKG
jgi:hypothetical protein